MLQIFDQVEPYGIEFGSVCFGSFMDKSAYLDRFGT